MRIATIFVRTGTESFPTAEADVDALFAAQLPGVQREVVVVDNLLPPGVHEQQGPRVVVGGDNSSREFSAFDAGLRHIETRLHEFDWINLVTSAFKTLYTDYLAQFETRLLEAVAGRSVCLGHLDCYNEPVRLLGYPSQHWMRTSFVMLPPAELRLLGTVVSVRDRRPFFSGVPERPFLDDAPLSDRLKQYITDWLTGRDIGQGVVWHSKFVLDEQTLPIFEAKTLAILNEHLLGIRLRSQGCVVADISWLALTLQRHGCVRLDLPWREQLAECNRFVTSAAPAV